TRSRERHEDLAAAVMRYGARPCEPEARAPGNPLQRGRAQRGVRGYDGDAAPRGINPSLARHELADRNPRDAELPRPAEVREDEHAHHVVAGNTTGRSDPALPSEAGHPRPRPHRPFVERPPSRPLSAPPRPPPFHLPDP